MKNPTKRTTTQVIPNKTELAPGSAVIIQRYTQVGIGSQGQVSRRWLVYIVSRDRYVGIGRDRKVEIGRQRQLGRDRQVEIGR